MFLVYLGSVLTSVKGVYNHVQKQKTREGLWNKVWELVGAAKEMIG
jgi:hypothetical protein